MTLLRTKTDIKNWLEGWSQPTTLPRLLRVMKFTDTTVLPKQQRRRKSRKSR
jgi:hypothetical protein